MIQHWLSEKGLKAIQIMPAIEWGEDPKRYAFCSPKDEKADGVFFRIWHDPDTGDWCLDEEIQPHITLCLLQHQARKTTLAKGFSCTPDYKDGVVGAWGVFDMNRFAWKAGDTWVAPAAHNLAEHFPDEDEALIEALLSTEKK